MSRQQIERDVDVQFAERLLRGGIAPRYVRRSLRELRDHRLDLMEQLEQQGHDPGAAAREAQMLLGHRDALAEQILARPELRSRARRFAWLLFGVAPLFANLVLSGVIFFTVLAIGGFTPESPQHPMYAQGALHIANHLVRWVVPTGVGIFLGIVALRRRMSPAWPITSIVLTAWTSAATRIAPHEVSIGAIPFDTFRALILVCGLLMAYALASMASRGSHHA
jgi:hypothetical protein